jgi:hypothetical protein
MSITIVFKKKEEATKDEEKVPENKPGAFSFVKHKALPKQESEDLTRHSMQAKTDGPVKGSFNFIKKATGTSNNNDSNNTNSGSSIAVSVNLNNQEQNADINTYGNIDQFLTENATNLGNNKANITNTDVKDNFSSNDVGAGNNDDNRSEKKLETKPSGTGKSFNFIKKQKEIHQDETKSQKTEEIYEPSDMKSLKSLRINNTDALSMTNEDDVKSLKHKTSSASDMKITAVKSTKELVNVNKPPTPTNLNNPEKIKSKCEADLQKNEESFENLVVKIHTLKLKLKAKEILKEELNSELEQNIQKEEEAIQNNDFDTAQDIENNVCELRDRIEAIALQITELNKDMTGLRDNELLLIRNKTKVIEESMNAFNKLKSNQEYELETFQNNDINKHKNDHIKIKKLKEKLEILHTNLENEKSVNEYLI